MVADATTTRAGRTSAAFVVSLLRLLVQAFCYGVIVVSAAFVLWMIAGMFSPASAHAQPATVAAAQLAVGQMAAPSKTSGGSGSGGGDGKKSSEKKKSKKADSSKSDKKKSKKADSSKSDKKKSKKADSSKSDKKKTKKSKSSKSGNKNSDESRGSGRHQARAGGGKADSEGSGRTAERRATVERVKKLSAELKKVKAGKQEAGKYRKLRRDVQALARAVGKKAEGSGEVRNRGNRDRGNQVGRGDDGNGDEADEVDPATVDKVIAGRVKLAKAKDKLSAELKKVKAGKQEASTYRKHRRDVKTLERKVDAQAEGFSDEHNELIDEVVAGHQELAGDQKQLAALKKKVAAGDARKATYKKHAAALADRRDEVGEQTQELWEASDYDEVPEAEPGKNGAGAACGHGGALRSCNTVAVNEKTGAESRDSCSGLAGLTGCTARSNGNGAVKAVGDCGKTCKTRVQHGKRVATTRCSDCITESTADATTVSTGCEGRCRSNSTAAHATRVASGKATAKGDCTGCDLDTEVRASGGRYRADVGIDCSDGSPSCGGRGVASTSVEIDDGKGGMRGVRQSGGTGRCAIRGGTCDPSSTSEVTERRDSTGRPTGLEAVSHADAVLECGSGGDCGGTASSSTSARDTAVSKHWRGSGAKAEVSVAGGGSGRAETGSDASSGPAFAAVDPAMGRPLRGPSSVSSASASADCSSGAPCTASTSSWAFDGAVAGGKPRTSHAPTTCESSSGGCVLQSVSTSSSGPGAAQTLSGTPATAARWTPGPSAASASGGALTCAGTQPCAGKVTSAATATDPAVSADSRGTSGTGSCSGVKGAVCRAVTNSASSAAPDANSIGPLVQQAATDNATVTSDTVGDPAEPPSGQPPADQPAVPAGSGAPGSSASSGSPTVPGASSWSMSSADLDCPGGITCSGKARSSAVGMDGPDALHGAGGARGPPRGETITTGSCVSASDAGCQARTSSTASAGQVVADVIAEKNHTAAAEAQQRAAQAAQRATEAAEAADQPGATAAQLKTARQAAKAAAKARKTATAATALAARPVKDAPATLAESSATAQCAGAACIAATSGATAGVPGEVRTDASCSGASRGCAVTGAATAALARNTDAGGKQPAGWTGTANTDSQVECPEAGCVGTVNGRSSATVGSPDNRGRSTATGSAACSGTSPCRAAITASSTVAAVPADGTSGKLVTAEGMTAVEAQCTGTGCLTTTRGSAQLRVPGGNAKAASRSDCAAGAQGSCAGSSAVGASATGVQAAASCAGTKDARCSHSFRAEGHADAPGAAADATGHDEGRSGGGRVEISVGAMGDPASAQAFASCSGSKGVSCRYHFEASRSAHERADSGSYATATARGVGGGRMGSGSVSVAVRAYAQGNQAGATATCTGDGVDCSGTEYFAFAADSARTRERPPTETEPGGYWTAKKTASCGAAGSGGCGVAAFADPNDERGGSAQCTTGSCPNFWESAYAPSFVKTAEPTGPKTPLGPDGKPLPEGKAGPPVSSAWAGEDANGNPVLKVLISGEKQWRTCSGACVDGLKPGRDGIKRFAPVRGGPKATYNPNAADDQTVYGASDGVGGKGGGRHQVNGRDKASIGTDAQGRTVAGWRGDAYVKDGRTGKTRYFTAPRRQRSFGSGTTKYPAEPITPNTSLGKIGIYDAPNPFGGTINTGKDLDVRFSDRRGTEKLQVRAKWITFRPGRGGTHDNAGFKFSGSGTYSLPSADLDLRRGVVDVVAPDNNGLGGSIRVFDPAPSPRLDPKSMNDRNELAYRIAECICLPEGKGKSAEPISQDRMIKEIERLRKPQDGPIATIATAGGGTLECDRCDFAMHRMPTEAGKGGVNSCKVSAGGATCLSQGAPWKDGIDVQNAEAGQAGEAKFVQFLRDKRGRGGGAAAFTRGTGKALGIDAYFNWTEAGGEYGGMATSYAESADGYSAGQACPTGNGRWCRGSDPDWRNGERGERIRMLWAWPSKDTKKNLDRTYERRDMQRMSWTDPLLDSARVVVDFTRAQSQYHWAATKGIRKLKPLAEVAEGLLGRASGRSRDGVISDADVGTLLAEFNKIDPESRRRLGRTDVAVDIARTVLDSQIRRTGNTERLLGQNPSLVAAIDRYYREGRYKHGKGPLPPDIDRAKRSVIAAQGKIADSMGALDASWRAWEKRKKKWDKAVAGFTPGVDDPAKLERERQTLNTLYQKLQDKGYRIHDGAAGDKLAGYGLAAAMAGGEPSLVADLRLVRRIEKSVSGLIGKLPDPESAADHAGFEKLNRFVGWVASGSEAVAMDAAHRPGNRLDDMLLPRTLAPDLALAMRSAAAFGWVKQHAEASGSPFVHEDGTAWSMDELSDFAATWHPNPKARLEDRISYGGAMPKGFDQVSVLGGREVLNRFGQSGISWDSFRGVPIIGQLAGILGDEGKGAGQRKSSYEILAGSSPGMREKLEARLDKTQPWLSATMWADFGTDMSRQLSSEAVRNYDRRYGPGTDSWLRNAGRDATSLTAQTLTMAPALVGMGYHEMNNNRVTVEVGGVAVSPQWVPWSSMWLGNKDNKGRFELPGVTVRSEWKPRPRDEYGKPVPFHRWYTERNPLTGSMVVEPLVRFRHLVTDSDHFRTEMGKRPFSTVFDLATPVMLVGGGVGAGLRVAGAGATMRAAGLRNIAASGKELRFGNGRRALDGEAARWEARAHRLNRWANYADMPVRALGKATALPYVLPGRMAAFVGGKLAGVGSRFAKSEKWAVRLARTSDRAGLIARHGYFRMAIRGGNPYKRLGIRPWATHDQIGTAYDAKLAKLRKKPRLVRKRPDSVNDAVVEARKAALDAAMDKIAMQRAGRASALFAKDARKAAKAAEAAARAEQAAIEATEATARAEEAARTAREAAITASKKRKEAERIQRLAEAAAMKGAQNGDAWNRKLEKVRAESKTARERADEAAEEAKRAADSAKEAEKRAEATRVGAPPEVGLPRLRAARAAAERAAVADEVRAEIGVFGFIPESPIDRALWAISANPRPRAHDRQLAENLGVPESAVREARDTFEQMPDAALSNMDAGSPIQTVDTVAAKISRLLGTRITPAQVKAAIRADPKGRLGVDPMGQVGLVDIWGADVLVRPARSPDGEVPRRLDDRQPHRDEGGPGDAGTPGPGNGGGSPTTEPAVAGGGERPSGDPVRGADPDVNGSRTEVTDRPATSPEVEPHKHDGTTTGLDPPQRPTTEVPQTRRQFKEAAKKKLAAAKQRLGEEKKARAEHRQRVRRGQESRSYAYDRKVAAAEREVHWAKRERRNYRKLYKNRTRLREFREVWAALDEARPFESFRAGEELTGTEYVALAAERIRLEQGVVVSDLHVLAALRPDTVARRGARKPIELRTGAERMLLGFTRDLEGRSRWLTRGGEHGTDGPKVDDPGLAGAADVEPVAAKEPERPTMAKVGAARSEGPKTAKQLLQALLEKKRELREKKRELRTQKKELRKQKRAERAAEKRLDAVERELAAAARKLERKLEKVRDPNQRFVTGDEAVGLADMAAAARELQEANDDVRAANGAVGAAKKAVDEARHEARTVRHWLRHRIWFSALGIQRHLDRLRRLWSELGDEGPNSLGAEHPLYRKKRDGKALTPTEFLVLYLEGVARSEPVTKDGRPVVLHDEQLYAILVRIQGSWRDRLFGKRTRGVMVRQATGEGKSLVDEAVVQFHAYDIRARHGAKAPGHGVHLLKINQDQARKQFHDGEGLRDWFGLDGQLLDDTKPGTREHYDADITYGTPYSFMWDALLDRRRRSAGGQPVQRGHSVAVVDEIDTILVDWARNPLRLAEPVGGFADVHLFYEMRDLAHQLEKDKHYTLARGGEVTISDAQIGLIEEHLNKELTPAQRRLLPDALWARHQVRDIHHLVRDKTLAEILNNDTGYSLPGQRYRGDRHSALEAELGLLVRRGQNTLDEINVHRYMSRYERVTGSTGTVDGVERLVRRQYGLRTVHIPRHKPDRRTFTYRVFATESDKHTALVEDILAARAAGERQPHVVFVRTIPELKRLQRRLHAAGVDTDIVTALDADLAKLEETVRRASRKGAIVLATNIISRGTDIRPTKEALEAGGVRATVASMFGNRRARGQAFGRPGRQGDRGRIDEWLALDDPMLAGSPFLQAVRKRTKGGEITTTLARWRVQRSIDRMGQLASKNDVRRAERVILGKDEPDTEVVRTTSTTSTTSIDEFGGLPAEIDRLGTDRTRARRKVFGSGDAGGIAELYRIDAELDRRMAEYRAQARGHTLDEELAGDSAADASPEEVATELVLSLSEVRKARELARNGRYTEAKEVLRRIAAAVGLVNAFAGLEVDDWALDWLAVAVTEQALATLQRISGTGVDGANDLTDDLVALAVDMDRLESVVATLPAGVTVDRRAAEISRRLRQLERAVHLAGELASGPADPTNGMAELADLVGVARMLYALRAAGVLDVSNADVEPLALEQLRSDELALFIAWADGMSDGTIAAMFEMGTDEVAGRVEAVLRWLTLDVVRRNALSESGARRQAREAADERESRHFWRVIRDRLRAVEEGMSPAERSLWDREDRIEELIAHIEDAGVLNRRGRKGANERHNRLRNEVYGVLVDAGITSIAELAAMDDEALAAIGLDPSSIKAVRKALSRRTSAEDNERRAAEQAAQRRAAELADAMRHGVTAEHLRQALQAVVDALLRTWVRSGEVDVDRAQELRGAIEGRLEGLLGVSGVDDITAIMEAMDPAATALLERAATTDGLSRDELEVLIQVASGAVPSDLDARLVALAVLHTYVGKNAAEPARNDNAPTTPAERDGLDDLVNRVEPGLRSGMSEKLRGAGIDTVTQLDSHSGLDELTAAGLSNRQIYALWGAMADTKAGRPGRSLYQDSPGRVAAFAAVVITVAGGGMAVAGLPINSAVLASGGLAAAWAAMVFSPQHALPNIRGPPALRAALANLPRAALVGAVVGLVFGIAPGLVATAGVLVGLTARTATPAPDRAQGRRPAKLPVWGVLAAAGVLGYAVTAAQAGNLLVAGAAPWFHEFALTPGRVLAGDRWQLLTSGFLHVDLAHLVPNLIFLVAAGRAVERMLGKARALGVALAGLLAGGMAVVLTSGAPVAGASAAVIALLGAALVRNPRDVRMWVSVIAVGVGTFLLPNISIASHVAGLLAGVAVVGIPALLSRLFPAAGAAPAAEPHQLGPKPGIGARLLGWLEQVRRAPHRFMDQVQYLQASARGKAVAALLAATLFALVYFYLSRSGALDLAEWWRQYSSEAGVESSAVTGGIGAGVLVERMRGTPTYHADLTPAEAGAFGRVNVALVGLHGQQYILKRGRGPRYPVVEVAANQRFRRLGGLAPKMRLVLAEQKLVYAAKEFAERGRLMVLSEHVTGTQHMQWWDLGFDARADVFDQLAVQFVPNAIAGNRDGVMPANVLIDEHGRAIQIDFDLVHRYLPDLAFDPYMIEPPMSEVTPDGSLVSYLRYLLHTAPAIYGRLGEDEVVALLRDVFGRSDALLATVLDAADHQRTLADLGWIESVLAAADANASEPLGAALTESLLQAADYIRNEYEDSGGFGDRGRRNGYRADLATRADRFENVRPVGAELEMLDAIGLARRVENGELIRVHDVAEESGRRTISSSGDSDRHAEFWVDGGAGLAGGSGSLAAVPGYEYTGGAKAEFEGQVRARLGSARVDARPFGRRRGPSLASLPRGSLAEDVLAYTLRGADGRAVVVMFDDARAEWRELREFGLAEDFERRVYEFEVDVRVRGGVPDAERMRRAEILVGEVAEARERRDRGLARGSGSATASSTSDDGDSVGAGRSGRGGGADGPQALVEPGAVAREPGIAATAVPWMWLVAELRYRVRYVYVELEHGRLERENPAVWSTFTVRLIRAAVAAGMVDDAWGAFVRSSVTSKDVESIGTADGGSVGSATSIADAAIALVAAVVDKDGVAALDDRLESLSPQGQHRALLVAARSSLNSTTGQEGRVRLSVQDPDLAARDAYQVARFWKIRGHVGGDGIERIEGQLAAAKTLIELLHEYGVRADGFSSLDLLLAADRTERREHELALKVWALFGAAPMTDVVPADFWHLVMKVRRIDFGDFGPAGSAPLPAETEMGDAVNRSMREMWRIAAILLRRPHATGQDWSFLDHWFDSVSWWRGSIDPKFRVAWSRITWLDKLHLILILEAGRENVGVLMLELPKRRRSARGMQPWLRIVTEPAFGLARIGLDRLVSFVPEEEQRKARSHFIGAVLEFGSRLVDLHDRGEPMTWMNNHIQQLINRIEDEPKARHRVAEVQSAAARLEFDSDWDPGSDMWRLERYRALAGDPYGPAVGEFLRLIGQRASELTEAGIANAKQAALVQARHEASRAAWSKWEEMTGRWPVIAREEAPLPVVIRLPDGREATIEVARDFFEVIDLGHDMFDPCGSGDSCTAIPDGRYPQYAGPAMHPRVGVVYAKVDGRPVARVTLFRTGDDPQRGDVSRALLPVSMLFVTKRFRESYDESEWEAGYEALADGFNAYVDRWATESALDVVHVVTRRSMGRGYNWLRLSEGENEAVAGYRVVLSSNGVGYLWDDMTWDAHRLPYRASHAVLIRRAGPAARTPGVGAPVAPLRDPSDVDGAGADPRRERGEIVLGHHGIVLGAVVAAAGPIGVGWAEVATWAAGLGAAVTAAAVVGAVVVGLRVRAMRGGRSTRGPTGADGERKPDAASATPIVAVPSGRGVEAALDLLARVKALSRGEWTHRLGEIAKALDIARVVRGEQPWAPLRRPGDQARLVELEGLLAELTEELWRQLDREVGRIAGSAWRTSRATQRDDLARLLVPLAIVRGWLPESPVFEPDRVQFDRLFAIANRIAPLVLRHQHDDAVHPLAELIDSVADAAQRSASTRWPDADARVAATNWLAARQQADGGANGDGARPNLDRWGPPIWAGELVALGASVAAALPALAGVVPWDAVWPLVALLPAGAMLTVWLGGLYAAWGVARRGLDVRSARWVLPTGAVPFGLGLGVGVGSGVGMAGLDPVDAAIGAVLVQILGWAGERANDAHVRRLAAGARLGALGGLALWLAQAIKFGAVGDGPFPIL